MPSYAMALEMGPVASLERLPFIMPRIHVTKEAYTAIRAAAILPFDDSGVRSQPNGEFAFDIDSEVCDKLGQLAFPGESISDTLIRVLATANKPKQ